MKSCVILSKKDENMLRKGSVCVVVCLNIFNQIADFIPIEVDSFLWLKSYGETLVHLVEGYLLSTDLNVTGAVNRLENKINALKNAIHFVTNCAIQKALTFNDLNILASNFEHYKEIWQLLSFVEKPVELKFVEASISLYDVCVKDINYSLIRSPKNGMYCSVTTLPALKIHGIVLPKSLSHEIERCLKCSATDRKYKPDEMARLCDLESLSNNLLQFIEPIDQSLDTLLFVAENSSYILNQCINHFKEKLRYFTLFDSSLTSSEKENMLKLDEVIKLTEKYIFSLTDGSSSFTDVLRVLSLDFLKNDKKFGEELNFIAIYLELKLGERSHDCNAETMNKGLKALVILLDITDDLNTLYKTCEMFGLDTCLKDPEMNELQDIFKELSVEESHEHITLNTGICKLNVIMKNLKVIDIKHTLIFKLVSTIQQASSLHRFCKFRGFNSVEGYQTFISQHKLVTIAMDKEDYCEEILNQLRGAMLFISPFFNRQSTLSQLMSQLATLTNVPVGISQLQSVEANIDTIELSFNTIEVSFLILLFTVNL